jgi:hypothetical protein
MPKYTDPTKEAKKYRKHLVALTDTVKGAILAVDSVSKRLATDPKGTGAELAQIMNALEMVNDQARFFGLGIDFRTGKMPKK